MSNVKPREFFFYEPHLRDVERPNQANSTYVPAHLHKLNPGYTKFVEASAYDQLYADLMEAREALRFYASKRNWGEPGPDQRDWYLIESTDRGDKARKALSKLDEKYPVKDEA